MNLICFHGAGVRGNFWNPLKKDFSNIKNYNIENPDLDFSSIKLALDSCNKSINKFNNQTNFSLIAHSFSSILVLTLLSKNEMTFNNLKKVFLLGCPNFKQNNFFLRILMKTAMKYGHYLPSSLWQSQFFNTTPYPIQKNYFKKVVREKNDFINEITRKKMI